MSHYYRKQSSRLLSLGRSEDERNLAFLCWNRRIKYYKKNWRQIDFMFQLFTVVLDAVMIRDTNNCTFFVIKVKPFASQSYKLYWSELFRNLSRSFLHVRGNFLGVKRTNRPSFYVATLYIFLHTNIIVWPKHAKKFDTKDTLITSLFSFAKNFLKWSSMAQEK